MPNFNLIIFLCCGFFFVACNSSSQKPPAEEKKIIQTKKKPSQLIVEVDKLRFRDQAGEKGKVLGFLKKGEHLIDLGETSVFTNTITIRGVKYTEPWLKVKTTKGEVGWVFGGAVNFEGLSSSMAALKMRKRKLKTIFGDGLSKRILAYNLRYQNLTDANGMAELYKEGSLLRDSLVEYLRNRIIYENEDTSPDLFWLDKMLPGFVVQLATEGTVYYFFWDYKQLASKAKKTKGKADDDFMNLCLKVHEADSIEYFFSSWFLQTWDYGGYSLLGKGIHEKILRYMDGIYTKEALFATEILNIKEELMDDITNKHIEYWEDQSKILAEIDTIIKADFQILNQQDKIALTTRKKLFANYKKNKIKLNRRAGT